MAGNAGLEESRAILRDLRSLCGNLVLGQVSPDMAITDLPYCLLNGHLFSETRCELALTDELVSEFRVTKEALEEACVIQEHLNQSAKPIQAGFLKPTFTTSLGLHSATQAEND